MSNKYIAILAAIIVILFLAFGLYRQAQSPTDKEALDLNLYGTSSESTINNLNSTSTMDTPTSSRQNGSYLVTLKTSLGDIQFETYDADAPKASSNFISLAEKGFYNGIIFHRVIKGFMIQGGDPTGTGMGGPGYQFEDELNPNTESYKAGYRKGVVAMANSGPNTNGSQFFVMLENVPLDPLYTIFGKVVKGQEVVDKIGNLKTTGHPTTREEALTWQGPQDKPLDPPVINKVVVEKIK